MPVRWKRRSEPMKPRAHLAEVANASDSIIMLRDRPNDNRTSASVGVPVGRKTPGSRQGMSSSGTIGTLINEKCDHVRQYL